MQLPYAHLNLWRNPFGTPPAEDIAQLLVLPNLSPLIASISEALKTPDKKIIIQFMGKCGRGKSSHMRALHAHFSDAPYLYFPEPGLNHPDIPTPRLPKSAKLLFLDESQRIPWFTRQRLFAQKNTSLILATHKDHRKEFSLKHKSVTHIDVGELSPQTLRQIIEKRIQWAALKTPNLTITDELVHDLITLYQDDLRGMLGTLYELVQSMTHPGPIPLPSHHTHLLAPHSRHLKPGEERTLHSPTHNI